MIAQLSSGDEDTVIKAAAEFLGVDYTEIESEDVFPAKKRIYVDFNLLSEERLELIEQIAYAIKRTIAVGVGFRLYLKTHRVFKLLIPISHGGAVGQNMIFQPVAQSRKNVETFHVNQGAEIHFDMQYATVGKDRETFSPLPFSQGARLFMDANMLPVNQHRTENIPLDISAGSVSKTNFTVCIPDHKITAVERYRSAKGVIYSSHIKSHRIE